MIKILIINDENPTSDINSHILGARLHEVRLVNSDAEGLLVTQSWKPDIVIIDAGIPTHDGWKVCRDIRKVSQVPILILSILNNPNIVVRALDEGADDLLAKPVREEVLIAHINKLTRRKNPETNAFLNPNDHYKHLPPLDKITE